jgi:hypothetical protein
MEREAQVKYRREAVQPIAVRKETFLKFRAFCQERCFKAVDIASKALEDFMERQRGQ